MKFRKKPVVIDAVQFDGTPERGAEIVEWAQSYGVEEVEFHPFLADHFRGDPKVYVAHPDPYMQIKTLEGVMSGSVGDWIIRGVQGEFYPCKPDIFEQTYESASVPVLETPASDDYRTAHRKITADYEVGNITGQEALTRYRRLEATLLESAPVEPPVLPLLPKNDAEAEAMGWTKTEGDPFYRPAQPSEPPVLSRAAKLVKEMKADWEGWLGYVPDYFQVRHDAAADLARFDELSAILESLSQGDG